MMEQNLSSEDTSEANRMGTLAGLTKIELLGVGLAAFTGVVHFYMAYDELANPTESVLFVLAGAGFFLGVALYLRGTWPRWLYLGGAAFTGIQILIWVSRGMHDFRIGVVDKAVQFALILLLLFVYWQSRTQSVARMVD